MRLTHKELTELLERLQSRAAHNSPETLAVLDAIDGLNLAVRMQALVDRWCREGIECHSDTLRGEITKPMCVCGAEATVPIEGYDPEEDADVPIWFCATCATKTLAEMEEDANDTAACSMPNCDIDASVPIWVKGPGTQVTAWVCADHAAGAFSMAKEKTDAE